MLVRLQQLRQQIGTAELLTGRVVPLYALSFAGWEVVRAIGRGESVTDEELRATLADVLPDATAAEIARCDAAQTTALLAYASGQVPAELSAAIADELAARAALEGAPDPDPSDPEPPEGNGVARRPTRRRAPRPSPAATPPRS